MFDGNPDLPSPATIAAGVRRGMAHQNAETNLATARRRRDEIAAEMRKLTGLPDAPGGNSRINAQLVELDQESTKIVDSMHALREKVASGRVVHATAVRAALRPITIAAATRAYEASLALQQAVAVLDQVNDQLLRTHGEPYFIPYADLRSLVARLSRLAGLG